MPTLKFKSSACDLCQRCVEKCPFQALEMESTGIVINEKCRMCGVCVKVCSNQALAFEQKPSKEWESKTKWKGILVYGELEAGAIHPITYELLGEAKRLAAKVGYDVYAVLVGEKSVESYGQTLLCYGVKEVFVYEHPEYYGFKADSYTDAVADCIAGLKPSIVLIGATELGRSLAPRLSARFRTGLTADCTKLDIRPNTDLVQVRPAFGGNVMAQILIADARPQFATIRYGVMDLADPVENPQGKVTVVPVSDQMARSGIQVLEVTPLPKIKSIEEEDILVVAGRGVKNAEGVALAGQLADALGGQLCFTRPLVESGLGEHSRQIGLSGRTVRSKLIVTCGVSGTIQFASGILGCECIVAINTDPKALIFNLANYCIQDDLFQVIPELVQQLQADKKMGEV